MTKTLTIPDAVQLLNRLVNEPAIHAALAPGFGPLDFSAFFRHTGNVMMGNEDGVVLFITYGDGVFDSHQIFSERMTPRAKLAAARAALDTIFTDHGARAIVGAPPAANRGARYMARAVGFAPYGRSVDTLGRPCINYILERDAWAIFSAGWSAGLAVTSGHRLRQVPVKQQPKLH